MKILWKNPFSGAVICLLVVLIFFANELVVAQAVQLTNPSLEGRPGVGASPAGWFTCGATPDLLPIANKYCQIEQTASNGTTYVGALCDSNFYEGIGQRLSARLKKGKTYTLSVDLAFPGFYCNELCYGSFAVFGSSASCEARQVLWKSGIISHREWKRYTIRFVPEEDVEYILCGPYFKGSCAGKKYAAGILIDNFSSEISEVLNVEVSVRKACKGTTTGGAALKVFNGEAPYSYSWTPGGYTGQEISDVPAGRYEVKITDRKGEEAVANVVIGEYEVAASAVVTQPDCHDPNAGNISANVDGGIEPYRYSIDNGASYQASPVFTHLSAGKYSLIIKDENQCTVTVDGLQMIAPEAVPIPTALAESKATSCNYAEDGQIALKGENGTPPYKYSLDGSSYLAEGKFTHLKAGAYRYYVMDSLNCIVDGAVEVFKNTMSCNVFMPNAFSPNGDGINDVFKAKVHDAVTGFRLAVYGRWGQLVFETRNPDRGWDGGNMPSGSYLWVVTYTNGKQQLMQQQGNLTLVR